jgi:hypothetical protein
VSDLPFQHVRRLGHSDFSCTPRRAFGLQPHLEISHTYPELYRTVAGTLTGSAALIFVVGLTDWGAKGTLGAMVLLLGLPIATGLAVWLRRTDAADLTLHA